MTKLDAKQLRNLAEGEKISPPKRFPVYMILDNILDTYNIGGHFRLADALSVKKMYLCGDTETPPNHRIQKASVGTWKVVPWEYCASATEAIKKLRSQFYSKRAAASDGRTSGVTETRSPEVEEERPLVTKDKISQKHNVTIISIEQHERAVPYHTFHYTLPLAFVVGHETRGVSDEALKASDAIVQIPMFGVNKSLNVIVSAAVVAYHAYGKLNIIT